MSLRFDQTPIPDILDCLAELNHNLIPTPPSVAKAMLDILPEHVWSDPTLKWLDPGSKSGVFLREIAIRLMDGLTDWEPDFIARREHIFRNMLFGAAVTEMTGIISRRSVYCSRDAASELSVVQFGTEEGSIPFVPTEHTFGRDGKARNCDICGAPRDLERGNRRENYAYSFIHGTYPTKEMAGMKFDVIVGNPPYQIGDGRTSETPIYNLFVDKAVSLNPKYILMIVPSRWFAGGKGLDDFRARMIADRRLRVVVDNPDAADCFPGVEIKGGVNYFLWDRAYDGDCEFSTRVKGVISTSTMRDLRAGHGVLLRDNKADTIVQKARAAWEHENLVPRITSQFPFGQAITTNYAHAKTNPFPGSIPLIFGDKVEYVRPDQIQRNHEWVDRWKVLLPMASDGRAGESLSVLGEPIALAPGSACTQTYLVAGLFDARGETENYAHYLCTKFVRFLVLQRKITQHVTPDRFRFVPMMDMTRRWTDPELYEHFGLDQDEIDYIEKRVGDRSPNLSLDSPIPASHLPGGYKYRAPKVAR